MRRLLLITFVSNFAVFCCRAQNGDVNLIQIIPPSPTAASLAKFGEIPVSPYTGLADISIPLYEVTNKEISVPIALKYHSGGIKVSEEASWVGLGWSLLCGGTISRMVRGLDDLPTGGSSNLYGFPDCYIPNTIDLSSYQYVEPGDQAQVNYDKNFLNDVMNGLQDTEPDIFTFNFCGRSGKFVLSKRSNPSMPLVPVLLSQEDIRIEVSFSSDTYNYQWIITDEQGIKYFFNTIETSVSRSGAADEESVADINALEGSPVEVVSSWYLDKIISPTGAEVNFTYYSSRTIGHGTKRMLSRSQIKSHVTYLQAVNGCTVPMNEFTYLSTYTEAHDVYLEEITFANGKIEFKLSDREDIEPVEGSLSLTHAKKVDEIAISVLDGESYSLLKKFIFNYSYFGLNHGFAGKRLKLLSVSESYGPVNLPPYIFAYNSLELPEKDSKSVDHWGYYNGADNASVNETTYGDIIFNGTLVPPARVYLSQSGQWREYAGADREPNPNFAQACMLNAITYPTGGTSYFEYELNDYYDPRTVEVETPDDAFIQLYGPNTQIPNPIPSTITIELTQATAVNVATLVQCFDGKTCLEQGYEYEYDVARIESLENTPFLDQWIGYLLTYDNQDQHVYQEMVVNLPAGKYKFTVFADQSYVSRLIASWTISTPVTEYNSLGAGLRIKKVITYDGVSHENDQVTEYAYSKVIDGKLVSTGKLMVEPVYEYEEHFNKTCETTPALATHVEKIVRMSSSIIPFSGSAMGNVIGYDQVTVTKGNLGKTEYMYFNESDQVFYPTYPNIPTVRYSANGLLYKELVYGRNENGTFKLLKEKTKTYNIGARRQYVRGMLVPKSQAVYIVYNYGVEPSYHNVRFYDIYSEWCPLMSEITKIYSQSDENTPVQVITTYQYNNSQWHQISQMSVSNSENKQITTTYKYPYDFSGNPVYDEMVNRNQIGNVIEKIVTLDDVHLESTKTNYNFWYNNLWGNNAANCIIVPQTIAKKTLDQPLFETRIRYGSYDDSGNTLSAFKENNVVQSYIWGHKSTYPIAEAINANPDRVAYTSFEDEDFGGWSLNAGGAILENDLITGKKSFSGSIFKTLPAGDYIVTAWATANINVNGQLPGVPLMISGRDGAWKLYQWKLTNATSVLIAADNMDEVRVHPADARMTTYTYDPLIGLTSHCDANHQITYFEYDGFGRLRATRDKNYNILEKFDYQYQVPVQ